MSASEEYRASQPSREVVAEAAAWITRLHGERRSPELEDALKMWLAADPDHARAFEGMTEIWDTMPGLAASPMPRVAVWKEPARAPQPWMRVAAAAVLCVVIAIGAIWLWPDPAYTTEIGEQRIVNLEDGTRVSMNSGTRMSVAYTNDERRIVLKEGEAYFEVAHNASVPFIVIAGAHRVTAVGTAFAVRRDNDRTSVTLVEGAVTVAPGGPSGETAVPGTASSSIPLVAGQRLTFAAAEAPQLDMPRLDTVTAWRRGELIFDEMLLADAIAEMNRYDKTPIVVDDPNIASLPVSGIYRTGDSTGFARIVARMYRLSAVREDGRIHLRRGDQARTH